MPCWFAANFPREGWNTVMFKLLEELEVISNNVFLSPQVKSQRIQEKLQEFVQVVEATGIEILNRYDEGFLRHQEAAKMFATIFYISNQAYRRYKTQGESFLQGVVEAINRAIESREIRHDAMEEQIRSYMDTIKEKVF